MASTNSFTPSTAGTKTVSATSSNSSTALNSADAGCQALRIVNKGPNTIFVIMGVGAQTASVTTSMPMLAGTVEVFTKGLADTIGLICNSTETATVYLSPGEGQ